ncbi:nuclear transport factor 2 family protein [Domibacillus sp. DTU_2020_1001157_1_SI_ALB_TIR_016]|uniref:nuclear transport factor 2 family protein n=1 Tax=Domibacillus sp. DTU_2020_1001157_1_SI_ALB_TIR_016 TaxID=3077789 RepID=UPI0028E9AE85|nr:nuclear transport factor 2 family protein [Domibacillus sp. DTU_2020_1001157_1_SI_ALB_TIR_016]WNS77894.1 nuclear transport factor 2 family protein [Domibacillus sp. DTU_2020_1001157_1_SI_ALB_TIR_016]
MTEKTLVIEHEEMLRQAMLTSNVKALDELIDHDLIFVNHFGQVLKKEADLEAHRSGVVNFTAITVTEQRVKLLDLSAITVTRVSLEGNAGADSIEEEMCYTRVWQYIDGKLKIISAIADPLNNLEKVSKFETDINKRTPCKRVSLLLLAEGRAANLLQRKWNECFWIETGNR